jgi:GGDEF domain-containing protein
MRHTTLIPRRQALIVAGSATYTAVFTLFLVFERPGLGIGHGFYVAVIFASLAGGPITGISAGLLATALYAIGIWINPHISPTTIPTLATSIRAVTYVAVGAVVGLHASRNRTLNRRLLQLTGELQMLAERDALTGLPSTRAFEPAITRRIDNDEVFALLIADVDGLKQINAANGYDEGNDLLRRLAEQLSHKLPPNSEFARVGDDEFAIVIRSQAADAPRPRKEPRHLRLGDAPPRRDKCPRPLSRRRRAALRPQAHTRPKTRSP